MPLMMTMVTILRRAMFNLPNFGKGVTLPCQVRWPSKDQFLPEVSDECSPLIVNSISVAHIQVRTPSV